MRTEYSEIIQIKLRTVGACNSRHVIIQCCGNWDKQVGCNGCSPRNSRTFQNTLERSLGRLYTCSLFFIEK